jgi:hypothetical protein
MLAKRLDASKVSINIVLTRLAAGTADAVYPNFALCVNVVRYKCATVEKYLSFVQ